MDEELLNFKLEYGRVVYENATYMGTVKNGVAHGYGTIHFNNGAVYCGEMQNNCMTGYGVLSTSEYKTFGSFRNGKREGICATIFKNSTDNFITNKGGDRLIGEYRNDQINGLCVYVYEFNDIYYGNFVNGQPHGFCLHSYNPKYSFGYVTGANYSNGQSNSPISYACLTYTDRSNFEQQIYTEYFFDELKNSFTGYGALCQYLGDNNHQLEIGFLNNFYLDYDYGFGRYSSFTGATVKEKKYGLVVKLNGFVIHENNNITGKTHDGHRISCSEGLEAGSFNKSDGHVGYPKEHHISSSGYYSYGSTIEYKFMDGKGNYHENIHGLPHFNCNINIPTFNGILNNGSAINSSNDFIRPSSPTPVSSGVKKHVSSNNNSASVESESVASQPVYSIKDIKRILGKTEEQIEQTKKFGYYSGLTPRETEKLKLRLASEEASARVRQQIKQEEEERNRQFLEREKIAQANKTKTKIVNETYCFKKGSRHTIIEGFNYRGKPNKGETREYEIPHYVTGLDSIFRNVDFASSIIFEKGKEDEINLNENEFENCSRLQKIDFSQRTFKEFILPKDIFKNCKALKKIIFPNVEKIWLLDKDIFKDCPNVELIFKGEKIDKDEFINESYDEIFIAQLNESKRKAQEEIERIKLQKEAQIIEEKRKKQEAEAIKDAAKEAEKKKAKDLSDKLVDELQAGKGYKLGYEDGLLTLLNSYKTIEKIIIPEGIEKIKNGVFSTGKKSIKEIIFPSTLKEIESDTFREFEKLEMVDLSKTQLTTFESGLFNGCKQLKKILLPKNLDTICNGAFKWCISLTKLELPNVETVKAFAFGDCRSLEEVFMPKVKTIEYSSFYFCRNLKRIIVGKDISGVDIDAFGKDMVKTVTRVGEYKHISAVDVKQSAFARWLGKRKWKKEIAKKD